MNARRRGGFHFHHPAGVSPEATSAPATRVDLLSRSKKKKKLQRPQAPFHRNFIKERQYLS